MRKIAIYGMGEFGQYIYSRINSMKDIVVTCFIDNYRKQGSTNLPVYTIEQYGKCRITDDIWVVNSNYYHLGNMITSLHENGFDEVTVVKPELWEKVCSKCGELNIHDYIYSLDISYKAVLTKLEFHLCDHCNLNCSGCSHFSPIFSERFANIGDYEKNLIQLSSRYANILRFRLMGGEPFLHKDIVSFIDVTRKYLPNTHLEIVTNGLLIPKVEDKIWSAVKRANAVLNVSLYPPTFKIREIISNVLESNGINFSFGSGLVQNNYEGIIEEFHTGLTTLSNHDGSISAQNCMGRDCHYFRDGKISKCALPLLAPYVNDFFDLNFEVSADDYVDIYDESVSPWETVMALEKGTPFCDYCIEEGTARFKWHNFGEITKEDYFIY